MSLLNHSFVASIRLICHGSGPSGEGWTTVPIVHPAGRSISRSGSTAIVQSLNLISASSCVQFEKFT